ncbi:MAG: hypothetical protein ACREGI_04185, partial [Candidatus Levyibacteriota bacterium]
VKWHFMMTKAFLSFFSAQTSVSSVIGNISNYLQKFSEGVYYSLFSFNIFFAFLLTVGALAYIHWHEKDKSSLLFLDVWLFSTLPLFAFGSGVLSTQVINSSIFGAFAVVFALALYKLWNSRQYKIVAIFFVILVVAGNAKLFFQNSFTNLSLLPVQTLTIAQEKQVIDYTYQQAMGKPFSICTVSNPLFSNTLWGYLYNWYGKNTYHYVPFWAGQKQVETSILPYDTNHTAIRFLIVEPLDGISPGSLLSAVYLEDHLSNIVATQHFGPIMVQERQLAIGKKFVDSQNLTVVQVQGVEDMTEKDPRYSCFNSY